MWRVTPSRIVDLAVSPDGKRLVAIGLTPGISSAVLSEFGLH